MKSMEFWNVGNMGMTIQTSGKCSTNVTLQNFALRFLQTT